MSQLSDYLEGEILKHLLRTGSWTKPTTIAIALCTSAPVDSDTGALAGKEVANSNAYARQTLNPLDANWAAPSGGNGLSDNLAAITFPVATPSGWGTITHVAIVDSATHGAGNLLLHGALSVSKVVGAGDTFKFNIGDLDIAVA